MTDPSDRLNTPEAVEARYDLSTDEITRLTEQAIRELGKDVPEEYRFFAIEVGGTNSLANIGRHIERVVFEASFGNDADEMTAEYGPYEAASYFYISIDRETHRPTGVLRIIRNSEAGLKTLKDIQGPPFNIGSEQLAIEGLDDLDKVWDVGTIAVAPEYRGKSGPVSIQLERAMYMSAMNHDIEALVSIVDDRALTKMRSKWRGLGIPFRPLAGSKPEPYLGSPKSHAVIGRPQQFYPEMSRHRESVRGRMLARFALSDALDRLVEGTADKAILLNPDL